MDFFDGVATYVAAALLWPPVLIFVIGVGVLSLLVLIVSVFGRKSGFP